MSEKMSVVELVSSFPLAISEIGDFGDRMNISPSSDDREKVSVAFNSLVSEFAVAAGSTRDSNGLEVALYFSEFRELLFSLSIPERKFVAWFISVMESNGVDYAFRAVECFSWAMYSSPWMNVEELTRIISIEKMYRDCEKVAEILRYRYAAAI